MKERRESPRTEFRSPWNLISITSVVAGVEKQEATGGRRLGSATVQVYKQGIPSFGRQLSGHEFSGIYYPSALRLFYPLSKIQLKRKTCPPYGFLSPPWLQGLKNWGQREGDVWATAQLSKQGIPSFGKQLSGHEFSGIYYPSAFRLFYPLSKIRLKRKTCPPCGFLFPL